MCFTFAFAGKRIYIFVIGNVAVVNRVIVFLILAIQREEDKVKRSLKEAAKKGDKGVCTILAKEVIRARKAITKIHTSKAHLNSIQLQMKNQLGKKALLSVRIWIEVIMKVLAQHLLGETEELMRIIFQDIQCPGEIWAGYLSSIRSFRY
jgi:charged multivesicular body protein 3